MDFSKIQGFVFDMDGVLWRGNQPLPGLAALFELLHSRALPYALATNNSGKSPADYVAKLASMGVPSVPQTAIITSATATAAHLREHYPQGTLVHVLGGDGLRLALADAGFTLADDAAYGAVRAVVVGIDWELTYSKLRRATTLIRAGAAFYGTNPDRTFPTPEGLAPGAGSIIAAVATATDVQPQIIGKPHPPMFNAALHLLGTSAAHTVMVGDRLDTDILGAQQAGMRAALVLSGVTTREELATSAIQPDAVFNTLPELLALLGIAGTT